MSTKRRRVPWRGGGRRNGPTEGSAVPHPSGVALRAPDLVEDRPRQRGELDDGRQRSVGGDDGPALSVVPGDDAADGWKGGSVAHVQTASALTGAATIGACGTPRLQRGVPRRHAASRRRAVAEVGLLQATR